MSIKQQRTAESIRKHLSRIFMMEMRDPRLAGLVVTEVKIDRELKHAHVYVASADDAREGEVMPAIGKASGFLRHELAQRIQLRTMPQLYFHWDVTLAQVARINDLLDGLDIPDAEEVADEVAETTAEDKPVDPDNTI